MLLFIGVGRFIDTFATFQFHSLNFEQYIHKLPFFFSLSHSQTIDKNANFKSNVWRENKMGKVDQDQMVEEELDYR